MIDKQSLLALFDDETLVRKYLQRFTDDMPELLRLIRLAHASQQWSDISCHAHSYKSQMQYINDLISINLATELEQSSVIPDSPGIEQLINQLEEQLNITLEEIRQII